jgi:hypothetical protein
MYLAGDYLSAADITFAALVCIKSTSVIILKLTSLQSSPVLGITHQEGSTPLLQSQILLKANPFSENCGLQRLVCMCCDYTRRNVILTHLYHNRNGHCLDYGKN